MCIKYFLHFRRPLFISGEGLMKSKASLSEESKSDHMTLLRAFQGWQESGNGGDFCTSNNLSQVRPLYNFPLHITSS